MSTCKIGQCDISKLQYTEDGLQNINVTSSITVLFHLGRINKNIDKNVSLITKGVTLKKTHSLKDEIYLISLCFLLESDPI